MAPRHGFALYRDPRQHRIDIRKTVPVLSPIDVHRHQIGHQPLRYIGLQTAPVFFFPL